MKRFCTKFLAILLALCMVIAVLPIAAFAESGEDTEIKNAKVSIWGVDSPYDFSFDFQSLTEGDNTVYSQSLSVFASLMAEDVSIQKKTPQIVVDGRSGSFMEQMGFEDIVRIDLGEESYDHDPNDTSVVYIGRRPLKAGNQEYVVYGVGIVDSYRRVAFGKSNVDIGAAEPEYNDVTGEHDPWNKDHAKGFDVAANRVYATVENYLNTYAAKDDGKTKTMLITGHSRGAAIANLVGKQFEDAYVHDGEIKPYTYTYATPCTTTVDEDTAQSYKTIFNIINENDLVTYVPPTDVEDWTFRRYGTDKIVDIAEDEDMVEEWNKTIAPMIEGELNTPSKNGSGETAPVMTSEKALQLLAILKTEILENKALIQKEKIPEYDELIAELEELEIPSDSITNGITYHSACGAEVSEIIGELIPSRKALYTKDVATTLSYERIIKKPALKSYYDITGKKDTYNNVPVNVCPAFFLEAAFSSVGQQQQELDMDYVMIILQGLLHEESGRYLWKIIQALLYAPDLIYGLRPCHSAQTYYFLANKIPSDTTDERQQEDPGKKEVTKTETAQNSQNVQTGIQHHNDVFYAEIGCIGVLFCIAVAMLLYRRKG